jgi:hypothetical protein
LREIEHIHEKYPIEINDSSNRTIVIYKPIKKILFRQLLLIFPFSFLKVKIR